MAARDVFGIVGTTQAGNFHVERVVAEGGFGVVYRAQHGAFRAPVAIKCLKIPEQMTKQQRATFLEKFREEAELMFRLSAAITEVVRPLHVDVLHLGDGRFVPFLALEWLEGESLDGIITRRREQGQAPLGLHKVVKMLRPVASALARAHRFPGPQGAIAIIHRDLKPENIFVANIGGTESMKILDFGIAKAKRAASQAVGRVTGRTLEEDESASFTPAYGAPEQWSPKTYGETGPWTDVWGLALSLVEALCGTPPIDGDTYVMRRACLDEKKRPTPRNLGADVPIEIEKVFERALAVDPRKRFKEIESFWSELEVAMGLEPSLRTRDARREPGEPAAAEQPAPSITATGSRLARIELAQIAAPAVRIMGDPVAKPAEAPQAAKPEASAARPARSDPASTSKASAAPEEDWSTLGLADAPAAKPPRKPMSRKHSVGLELPLESRANSVDLEAALPIAPAGAPPVKADGAPPTAIGDAPEPAKPAPARRASMDLELSLPTTDMALEPASQRAEPRKISGELELDLHVGDGAPPSSDALGRRPEPTVQLMPPGAGLRRDARLQRYAPSLGERLKAPLALVLVGLLLGLFDFAFLKLAGNPLQLGPVRLSWIAAPFALAGVGLLLWRLIGVHEDE